ncbi:MAG: STAS domain-containing protein [Nocardioides sp.]
MRRTNGSRRTTRGTGIGGRTMEIVHDGHTLWLSGDFDVRSTMEVRSAIHEHLYGAHPDLTIDLTGVDTIDLTAARVLAYASLEASRGGYHLWLRGCGPAVRRLLQVSRLARFVEVERAAATA